MAGDGLINVHGANRPGVAGSTKKKVAKKVAAKVPEASAETIAKNQATALPAADSMTWEQVQARLKAQGMKP